MSVPWLCLHLWEHYLYTDDVDYLRETAYPLMRDSALFLLDWQVEHDGFFVTAPSISPENTFLTEIGGRAAAGVSSAMDIEIITALFQAVRSAAAVLQADSAFSELLGQRLAKLPPLQIGAHGPFVCLQGY